ncbi:MAG: hypothetical protein WC561_05020 [Candidatus Omnitrophota bacterium]
MKIPALLLILFIGMASLVYSEQMISKIELNDGSVIEGEVTSLNNGIYSINTESLGQVEIDASKIRHIAFKNSATPAGNFTPAKPIPEAVSDKTIGSEMQRMQSKIAQDPESMKTVAGMLSDPQFNELLKDPAIVEAVKAQDIKTLMQNEKFMGLTDNQNILKLRDQLKEQEEQDS